MVSNIDRTAATFSSPSGSVSSMVKPATTRMVGTPDAAGPTPGTAAAVGGQGPGGRRTVLAWRRDGRSPPRSPPPDRAPGGQGGRGHAQAPRHDARPGAVHRGAVPRARLGV